MKRKTGIVLLVATLVLNCILVASLGSDAGARAHWGLPPSEYFYLGWALVAFVALTQVVIGVKVDWRKE